MGSAFSEAANVFADPPRPPPVILVPPRFHRDHLLLDRLFQTPLAAWLMSPERRRLFGKSGSYGRIVLSPPLEQNVVIDASLADNLSGQLSIRAYPNREAGDDLTAFEVFTRVHKEASSPLVRGAWFAPDGRLGVVGGASLDILMEPALLRPASDEGAPHDPEVAARLAAAGPDSTTGAFVGVRYHTETASAGAMLVGIPGPVGAGGEALGWVMGRRGPLTLAAETALPIGSAALPPSPTTPPLPLKFGAFYDGNGWNAALLSDSRSRTSVLGVYLHQVMRRRIQNPFERGDVVGIANYLDLGIEFRWTSLPPTTAEQVVRRPPATLDLAGSWQLNKAWLLKGSVSSSGLAALGAHVRSWSSLGISLGASIVADLRTRATQPAFSLMIENCGDLVYERPSKNAAFSHPTIEVVASSAEVWDGITRPVMKSMGSEEIEASNVGPRVTFVGGTAAAEARRSGRGVAVGL